MLTVTVEQKDSDGTDDCQLTVAQLDPTTIRVSAGSFNIAGTAYTLDEDEDWSFSENPTTHNWADGFLVWDVSAAKARLLVDEFEYGEFEQRFIFEQQKDYKLLHYLFRLDIPASTATLDSLEVDVLHYIPAT